MQRAVLKDTGAGLSFQILLILLQNASNKHCLARFNLVWQIAVASAEAAAWSPCEPIISSVLLLVTAQNEHEWTSEGVERKSKI